MKEYQQILDFYSIEGSGWFSRLVSEEKWGDLSLGDEYLKKYWLSDVDYCNNWKPLQDRIFIENTTGVPDAIFHEEYKMGFFEGGCLFISQEEFITLQKFMTTIGEQFFVVVENPLGEDLDEPKFRLKFPVSITWDELTSGNFVSSIFIESMYKEFFVFGEHALWGMYSMPDYKFPLKILGVQGEIGPFFKSVFKQTEEERKKIAKWLPENIV